MIWNKLVRDRIPVLMEAQGKHPVTRVLPPEEYLAALEQKLDEETREFHQDQTLEELADILEVICALAEARGWSRQELFDTCQEKNVRRGGFRDRIFLVSDGEETPSPG